MSESFPDYLVVYHDLLYQKFLLGLKAPYNLIVVEGVGAGSASLHDFTPTLYLGALPISCQKDYRISLRAPPLALLIFTFRSWAFTPLASLQDSKGTSYTWPQLESKAHATVEVLRSIGWLKGRR